MFTKYILYFELKIRNISVGCPVLFQEYEQELTDAKPPIISRDSIRTIFYKLRDILQCHKLFQMELAEVVRVWDTEEKIGDVFTASVGNLKKCKGFTLLSI